MALGYNAQVNASNKVVIGNSSVATIGGYASWSNYSDRRLQETLNELGLEFSGLIVDQDSMKTLNLSYVEFVVPLINWKP